jgi:hypothetical protein
MLLTLSLVTIAQATLFSQITDPKATEVWEPEPRKITPVVNNMPPSDAIVLFDGKNMDAWTDLKGNACPWQISESFLTVVPKRGDIKTKKQFGDCQIHIEWRAPVVVKGEGQAEEIVVFSFRKFMNYKFWIATTIEPILMDNRLPYINKRCLWLMPIKSPANGRYMRLFIKLPALMPTVFLPLHLLLL